ncbi:Golgi phosphoprotein 3 (GPP34) [Actinokineospora iranica]|uniref:Golgi phosphoprotein 3 (GPP34) n=1 Tax=Actinokineospora iranica TaxID=1271860 RepID=A0A1G6SU97_9PSEU|nr:Golgi phosphoprotein 3 (GPP34) [Actinokineospora iranica]
MMLLPLDDESGRAVINNLRRDLVIGGAVLLDLVDSGRVVPAGPEGDAKEGDAVVRDCAPTGGAVLDAAVRKLAEKPLKMRKAVEVISKDAREGVLAKLVERGLARREETKVLGIFRVKSWPAADTEHEAESERRSEACCFRARSRTRARRALSRFRTRRVP